MSSDNKGTTKWKYETQPLCESQIPDISPKPTVDQAFTKMERVLMESVNCTPIQMEVLNCEYMMITENKRVKWLREKFVNGPDAEIFSLDLPKAVGCKEHTSLRLLNKIDNPKLVPKVKSNWMNMFKVRNLIYNIQKNSFPLLYFGLVLSIRPFEGR
mgnify:CR=1 FL=1